MASTAMTAPAAAQGVTANEASVEDRGGESPNWLLDKLREDMRNAKPDPARTPADLTPVLATHKYVFRTTPEPGGGGRGFSIRIPVDRGYSNAQTPEIEALMAKKYRARTPESQRKKLDDLVERAGGVWINFRPAHRKFESFYATNDRVVAAWIREQIKSGGIAGVYEDPGTILLACEFCVRAGTEPPARFANSEQGRRDLVTHIRSEHPDVSDDRDD